MIQLVSRNLPGTIHIPGEVILNFDTKVTEVIPDDIIGDVKLKRMELFPVPVPCLNGIGSCPYDGKAIMTQLCQFAEPKCAFPIQPADYKFENVKLTIPDLGYVMDHLLKVHLVVQT